ncbi:MAG: hypothetical protein ABI045_00765 [Flavobacteriales bacterium]
MNYIDMSKTTEQPVRFGTTALKIKTYAYHRLYRNLTRKIQKKTP